MFDDFGFGIGGKGLLGLEEMFGLPASNTSRTRAEKKRCTLCSSTFDDLVKSGRVGCSECYKVFADELRNSIESIHGKAVYVGRNIPKEKNENAEVIPETKEDKIAVLKKELEKAISEQEFEKAAELRDRIKEIEKSAEDN